MDRDRLTKVLGFVGAMAVLGMMFFVIGIDEIVGALVQANLLVVLAVLFVAALWLSSWGMALHTVLRALETPLPASRSVLVFSGAIFSNNVTPFGQAGGEPLSALLISRAADCKYEKGLAAIASVDALHFMPSLALAGIGLSIFAADTVTLGRNLFLAAVLVGALIVSIPVLFYLGWRYRYQVEALVLRLLTPLIQTVMNVLPVGDVPADALIERRIEGFFSAIDRVAASRQLIVTALAFSAFGWLALSTSLWLSLFALGHPVAFAAPLIVIPLGSIASMTPLPGGLGGIEGAFIALLFSTTAVDPATASAAVLIHRGATYWLPTIFGGITVSWHGNGGHSEKP